MRTWGSIYRLNLETKAIRVRCNNEWLTRYRHLVKAKRQNGLIFLLWRLWIYSVSCTRIKSQEAGLIFRGDLGHREVDVGGEIVSYNFRHFKSPSQNAQPPTPFPEIFWGPSQSPHLAIHPPIHAAQSPPTHSSLNSDNSSRLSGSLPHYFMRCFLHYDLIFFILFPGAAVNSCWTQLAFNLLLDTEHNPVDPVGVPSTLSKWKLCRLML